MNHHYDLEKKVVVITGASSGFGKGTARALASRGAAVVLAARREKLLAELAQECAAAGGDALPITTDVSRQADVEQLAQSALRAFGRIDVWINDAGVGVIGRFDEVPLEDHAQVVEINLLGTIYGSYVALRQFRKQNGGTLINVASALGKIPAPYYASYTASKHGIVGLSSALRQELKQNNQAAIHVCTVMPMAMDTPFFDHASNHSGHQATPIPPLYDPESVIDAIESLVTHPRDEVIVGTAGKLADLAHKIAPKLTENILARQTHKTQMEQAPPASVTEGSLYTPMTFGTEVHGGRVPE
ncbi:MAG: SDR family oxidoreductase [Planctomycetaceae bacterium]|nr:SDR family oxidoreductase [Planctomycetaceae bacterium]